MPKGHNSSDETVETSQLWAQSNEYCPEGTIPIRRTTEKDVLRASSLKRFGRKIPRGVRHDTTSVGHEVSTVFNIFIMHINVIFQQKKVIYN